MVKVARIAAMVAVGLTFAFQASHQAVAQQKTTITSTTNDLSAANAKVIENLRQNGSRIDQPHRLDFVFYFPSAASANQVAAQLQKEGFKTDPLDSQSIEGQWVLVAHKTMIPELNAINTLDAHLGTLATAAGGKYDGWGAATVK